MLKEIIKVIFKPRLTGMLMMAKTISHEIGSQLQIIQLSIDIIQRKNQQSQLTEEELNKLLSKIEKAIQAINLVINKAKNIKKIQTFIYVNKDRILKL